MKYVDRVMGDYKGWQYILVGLILTIGSFPAFWPGEWWLPFALLGGFITGWGTATWIGELGGL